MRRQYARTAHAVRTQCKNLAKGFYSEKCSVEASIALCFEWAGYLVPRDVLLLFHNIVSAPNSMSNKTSCSDRIF